MEQLLVSEIFGPTIQGEGKTAGEKCIFLRLSGCNLHCSWCDSPYTWNWKGTDFPNPVKFDRQKELKQMNPDDIVKQIIERDRTTNTKRLVVTGGEPLLQQKILLSVLQQLKYLNWTIEIETNGTIKPSLDTLLFVDQFNVSPKLKNSGNEVELRRNAEALRSFVANPRAYFKFVVSSKTDIQEILNLILQYKIIAHEIYLMPLGKTQKELEVTQALVVDLCILHRFNYSPRLQISIWGDKRKV